MEIINVIGFVVKDPEVRTGKTDFTTFSVAVTHPKSETTWFDCVAFGSLGGLLANKIKKGNRVFVSGAFSFKKYTTKNGEEKVSFSVNVHCCEKLYFAEKNEDEHNIETDKKQEFENDDLPF